MESQHQVFYGTAGFLLSCMGVEIVYSIDLYFRNFLNFEPFPQFVEIGGPGALYLMVALFGFACIPLMYPLENVLMHVKSLWRTKIAIVGFLVLLSPVVIYIAVGNLVDLNTRTIIGFIGLIFLALSFLNAIGGTLYFYLRLGAKSPGFVRAKSYSIGFGFLITLLSILIYFAYKGTDIVSNIIPPLVLIIGLWLLLRGEQMHMDAL